MSKDPKFDREDEERDESKQGRKGHRGGRRRDRGGRHHSDVINDITTYLGKSPASAVVLDQSNTYSFTEFMGQDIDLGQINAVDSPSRLANIAQYVVNPAAGFTNDSAPKSDGLNIQALKWYSYLSAKNGKTTNYAPEDVMMLLLALGNVLAMFSFGARGLGLMFTYNKRNRAFPEVSIEAAGFEYASLRDNLADYKIAYNILVNKFNKIPIPGNFEYINKCSKMFQGIYLDEDGSSMAQSYVFVPGTYWLFDETYSVAGSGLRTVQLLASPNARGLCTVPFAAYLTALESQIDALLNSTTFNFIYADIMRLFENGLSSFVLGTIDYNYAILPAKIEELSIWLNNAIVLGSPESTPETVGTLTFTASNDVEANAAAATVRYRPQFRKTINWTGFMPIINFKHESPVLDERVYATRLYHQLNMRLSSDNTTYVSIEATLCDWYITGVYMTDGTRSVGNFDTSVSDAGVIPANTYIQVSDALTKFDWHPYLYRIYSSGGNQYTYIFGDTQYFTTINRSVIRRIQEICLMNQFDF